MMYLVTWGVFGKRNALLVADASEAYEHKRDIAGFEGVTGTGLQTFDMIDVSRVSVTADEHDRIVAALRAQIAVLEARVCAFACAIVTNEHGELLLIHNKNRGGWELPGGHIEPNEHPRDAAAREVREEAGVEARLDPLPCDALSGPMGVSFVYRGRAEGAPAPGDDADIAAWHSREWAAGADLSDIPSRRLVLEWSAPCATIEPLCVCPATSEYDPPCPAHGVLGIGVTGSRPRIDDPIVRRPR